MLQDSTNLQRPAVPAAKHGGREVVCDGDVCKLVKRKPSATAAASSSPSDVVKVLTVGSPLPAFNATKLGGASSASAIDTLRENRPAVLDFWTTKCVRCPAALDKLEAMASDLELEGVWFAGINIDDETLAMDIIKSNGWASLDHLFIDSANKALVQPALGMTSVPFYVILSSEGLIMQMGGPRDIDWSRLPALLPASVPISPPSGKQPAGDAGASSFTLDEDF